MVSVEILDEMSPTTVSKRYTSFCVNTSIYYVKYWKKNILQMFERGSLFATLISQEW